MRYRWSGRLCGLVLEEGDQVVAVLGLLETTEGHLGTRNVLLGVLEVVELGRWLATNARSADDNTLDRCIGRRRRQKTYQAVLVPRDTLLLVGVGVGEAVDLTGLAAKETVKLRADLVALVGLQGVALSATGL